MSGGSGLGGGLGGHAVGALADNAASEPALALIHGRDARDATVSTFDRPADGVALVDSTELDFEQTVAAVLAAVEDQAGIPAVKGGRR